VQPRWGIKPARIGARARASASRPQPPRGSCRDQARASSSWRSISSARRTVSLSICGNRPRPGGCFEIASGTRRRASAVLGGHDTECDRALERTGARNMVGQQLPAAPSPRRGRNLPRGRSQSARASALRWSGRQRLVSCILDPGVPELIEDLRQGAARSDQARIDQACQGIAPFFRLAAMRPSANSPVLNSRPIAAAIGANVPGTAEPADPGKQHAWQGRRYGRRRARIVGRCAAHPDVCVASSQDRPWSIPRGRAARHRRARRSRRRAPEGSE